MFRKLKAFLRAWLWPNNWRRDGDRMRRRAPDGSWEYRPRTDDDEWDELNDRAW